MRYIVEIDTKHLEPRDLELTNILRGIARMIEIRWKYDHAYELIDSNGNRVGTARFEE